MLFSDYSFNSDFMSAKKSPISMLKRQYMMIKSGENCSRTYEEKERKKDSKTGIFDICMCGGCESNVDSIYLSCRSTN